SRLLHGASLRCAPDERRVCSRGGGRDQALRRPDRRGRDLAGGRAGRGVRRARPERRGQGDVPADAGRARAAGRRRAGAGAADVGVLRLFGRTWHEAGPRMLDGVSGFIESPKFYPYLSGRKNLAGLGRLDGGTTPARIEEVLEIVDLVDRADDRVGGYSFGMRQRLGVPRSLLPGPPPPRPDEPAHGPHPPRRRDMSAPLTAPAGG